ncbi:MAG: class I SAM-dependent methyltransferase [Bacteroidota bacterium]|nr:class I SAM-dependent methyltransferase [Bacteroidota bacterium]
MYACLLLKHIWYLISSRHKRGHGIHSPFVFWLVSGVFRNKISSDIVCSIEKIRKEMIADTRSLIVNDLGAGSKHMKTNSRRVSEIARYSAVPRKYGAFLSGMSAAFGKPSMLEFGTSLGISTMYLAASSPDAMVYTMEGCESTSAVAGENFTRAGFTNITQLTGSFDDLLPRIKDMDISPGLVFIDGNHRKEPLLRYFDQVVEMSGSKTVVIIDDINSNTEMAEAWTEIRNHRKVSFSVDIFRMGIVFFRKGMTRFNYVIRY